MQWWRPRLAIDEHGPLELAQTDETVAYELKELMAACAADVVLLTPQLKPHGASRMAIVEKVASPTKNLDPPRNHNSAYEGCKRLKKKTNRDALLSREQEEVSAKWFEPTLPIKLN